MQSSTVAQRSAQSRTAASASAAAAGAQEGSWAERPLTCAGGQSSEHGRGDGGGGQPTRRAAALTCGETRAAVLCCLGLAGGAAAEVPSEVQILSDVSCSVAHAAADVLSCVP
jgi:hypothetical protein